MGMEQPWMTVRLTYHLIGPSPKGKLALSGKTDMMFFIRDIV
jgi:hypothetical protein